MQYPKTMKIIYGFFVFFFLKKKIKPRRVGFLVIEPDNPNPVSIFFDVGKKEINK